MRPDLPHPVLIDEFVVASASMPPDRLKIAVGELKNNPSDQLFLILYHPKSESQFKVREVIKKLKDFFDGESELDSDRYSIVSSASEGYRLQIYRIPPGADKPTP